jgi:D-sedoheptulose 7-phosphate isomerase
MNRVQQLCKDSADGAEYADGYLKYLSEVFEQIDNGGSASTASHWVNDLTRWRDRPFRAISLTDNVAVVTAYGNDFGYDLIFKLQLETLMQPDDVVVAISASGNSPNIVSAIDYANENGGITVGLTGFDGGTLRELAQIVVHAPTNKGEYGPAEDVHMVLDHLVTSYLEHVCAAQTA